VNKTSVLCILAYTKGKPLPAEADRGIADIGRLPGMAFGKKQHWFLSGISAIQGKAGRFCPE
jgi:hypothetical protein